jgi:hypothetical protein
MDRIISIRWQVTRNISLFLFLTAVATGASAGTVLAPAPSPDQPADNYPDSRFGQPPAKVDLGVGPSYVRHAVSELDPLRDEEGLQVPPPSRGRAPAGLEFSDKARSQPGSSNSNVGTIERPAAPRLVEQPRTTSDSPEPMPKALARSGVQEIAVIASDLGYFPRTIFVTRDLPVRLFVTGASKNTLCIMMDSFQIRKQVRSQKIEEITFTPNVPGKYRFYCPVNGMEGTLIVKEYSTGLETAWESSTTR